MRVGNQRRAPRGQEPDPEFSEEPNLPTARRCQSGLKGLRSRSRSFPPRENPTLLVRDRADRCRRAPVACIQQEGETSGAPSGPTAAPLEAAGRENFTKHSLPFGGG